MVGKQDYEKPKMAFLVLDEEDVVTMSVQTPDIYGDEWSDGNINFGN